MLSYIQWQCSQSTSLATDWLNQHLKFAIGYKRRNKTYPFWFIKYILYSGK